jgi:hypothetical protein
MICFPVWCLIEIAIVRNEGWRKLYSGFGSVLVCSAPARGAYFAGYEVLSSLREGNCHPMTLNI